jgi:hypothetical protein
MHRVDPRAVQLRAAGNAHLRSDIELRLAYWQNIEQVFHLPLHVVLTGLVVLL